MKLFTVMIASLAMALTAAAQPSEERVREQEARAREQAARVREEAAARAREHARLALDRHREHRGQDYERGGRYLDRREWEKALESYQKVIDARGARADGAHFWKAYALSKLGRGSEALAVLEQLRTAFPSSRWLNDAKALEVEIGQAAGRPVSPETEADEELKLLALNGLIHSDPERSVPLVEKIFAGSGSPKLKERALFVLAQAGTPRSREVVAGVARGGANPDLQIKAIEYLSIHKGTENVQTLADIYASSTDTSVKRAVLRGFMISRERERIANAARSESDADLRREAIRMLGAIRGEQTGQDLISLYSAEKDPELRKEILRALWAQKNAGALVQIARSETDPGLKKEAVQMLSMMKSKEATDYLMELLNK